MNESEAKGITAKHNQGFDQLPVLPVPSTQTTTETNSQCDTSSVFIPANAGYYPLDQQQIRKHIQILLSLFKEPSDRSVYFYTILKDCGFDVKQTCTTLIEAKNDMKKFALTEESRTATSPATICLDKSKQRLNQAGINAVQSLISKFGFSNMDRSTTDLIRTLCLAILKESELDVNKSYIKIVDAKNSKSIYALRNSRNTTAFEHRSFSGPCVYCHPLEFGQTLNINNKRTGPNSINVILNRTPECDGPSSRNFNPHFIYGGEPSFTTSLGQYAGEPSFSTSLGQYGGEPSFTTSLGQFAFGRM